MWGEGKGNRDPGSGSEREGSRERGENAGSARCGVE